MNTLERSLSHIRQRAAAFCETTGAPGYLAGVYHDGQQSVVAHGVANLVTATPMREDTGFLFGSITKVMTAGERLFVSAEVADFLDQLQALGLSQRAVQTERDMWILMQAVSPTVVATWVAEKQLALSDPEFRAIYLEYEAAFNWSPDDPRLAALAERARRWVARQRSVSTAGPHSRTTEEQAIARLIATSGGASSPAWDRLVEIIRERAEPG